MTTQLIDDLKEAQIVKSGDFTLKSGEKSNIYIDFRRAISYPKLFADLSYQLSKLIPYSDVVLAGVPTGAVPYACSVASILALPLIMIRSAKKDHGCQNLIEGDNFGKDIVLLEDVVTSGSSVLDTIKLLEENGKKVRKIITILDRGNGVAKIREMGYTITALLTLADLTNTYRAEQVISDENNITCRLHEITHYKTSNLIASLDLESPEKILEMLTLIAPHICGVKLHLDIINFTTMSLSTFSDQLQELKQKEQFVIIEDRKFADIPYISSLQLAKFPPCIDIVTTHCISGEALIKELNKTNIALLLIHKLSSENNLIDRTYSNKVKDMLHTYKNVVGVISNEIVSDNHFTFMPGVNLTTRTDAIGQTYQTPDTANGDIFIVGRGIYQSDDPLKSAIEYKEACWKAYRSKNRFRAYEDS